MLSININQINKPIMKQSIQWVLALLVLLAMWLGVLIFLSSTNNVHHCNWEDCNHQGQVMNANDFQSDWGYEEGTDGYYCELTHFMNPEMTYEQCEDYVFSGME